MRTDAEVKAVIVCLEMIKGCDPSRSYLYDREIEWLRWSLGEMPQGCKYVSKKSKNITNAPATGQGTDAEQVSSPLTQSAPPERTEDSSAPLASEERK